MDRGWGRRLAIGLLIVLLPAPTIFDSRGCAQAAGSGRLAGTPAFRSCGGLAKAAQFLRSQYDAELDLLYESSDSGPHWLSYVSPYLTEASYPRTFWLYSDNLFAHYALRPHLPTLSETIAHTIDAYQTPPSNLFEVLFGEDIPDIIHDAENLVIRRGDDFLVMARRHSAPEEVDISAYADLLCYRALDSYFAGEEEAAQHYFDAAAALFDGKGLADEATTNDGFYANYKLALILYTAKVIGAHPPAAREIEARLWTMQLGNGGFASLADPAGNPTGTANVETTSLALLAYDDGLIAWLGTRRIEQ